MRRDSLRVVAVPTPRSGTALFAGIFTITLHALALAALWWRPLVDLRSFRSGWDRILGVGLVSPEDVRPARVLDRSPEPRRPARLPAATIGEVPRDAASAKLPGAESIGGAARRAIVPPDAHSAGREPVSVPRAPAAAKAVSQMEVEMAAASARPPAAPKRSPLSGRLGPKPAGIPRGTPPRPKLSPGPKGIVPKRPGDRQLKEEAARPIGTTEGGGSPAPAVAVEALLPSLTPSVSVTARSLDSKELGRWVVFGLEGAKESPAVPVHVTVLIGSPAKVDAAAAEAVAKAAGSFKAKLQGRSRVRIVKQAGEDDLRRALARGGESPSAWVLAVSGSPGANDLPATQRLLRALPDGGCPARTSVVELSPGPAYASGWLARATGGAYRHAKTTESAVGAAKAALAEIGSVVFDPRQISARGGGKATAISRVPPAVFAGVASRFFLKPAAPGQRFFVVVRPLSASGQPTLPLAASGKLPAVADGAAARELAFLEIDRLLEFAARTGLSDETRRKIAVLAAKYGIEAPKLP